MIFKESHLQFELDQVPRFLYCIAQEFERQCMKMGQVATITRIFGKIEGDSGVHAAGRAIDFRDQVGDVFLFKQEQREYLLKTINRLFPRNDGHDTLIWHSFHDAPYHFHLQISADPGVYQDMFTLQRSNPVIV